MKKHKILFVHPSLGLGGAEKIIAFLANSVSEKYEVSFLSLKNNEKTLILNEKIRYICKPSYSEKPIFGKQMVSGIKDLIKMGRIIKNTIKTEQADLVICFDLRVLLAVNMVKINSKVLFSERADPYANPQYWKFLLNRFYKKIDYIVFQTEAAQAFYGDSVKKKSAIIPNPALMRIDSAVRRNLSNSQNYIFAAGRLQYRKGFDLLVNAFIKIASKHPETELWIYGEGEEKSKLITTINNSCYKDRVRLLNPINGVIEKNIQSRLFVIPSRSEGIPNILIEAMVAGIPCVATDCSPGGAKLLSENGKYCILAKNDDVESLASKLDYALSHSCEMEKQALNALKSMKRFDKEIIASKWLSVIENI